MIATAAGKVFHEYAEFFPLIEGDEFTELVDDIRENGLLEPIVLFDGKILDGRNRYRACVEAGVEPRYTDYAGDEPATYVWSKNIHRRHLSQTQRAVISIDMKPVIQEEIRKQDEADGIVRTEAGGAIEAPRGKSGEFLPGSRARRRGRWSERLAQKAGIRRHDGRHFFNSRHAGERCRGDEVARRPIGSPVHDPAGVRAVSTPEIQVLEVGKDTDGRPIPDVVTRGDLMVMLGEHAVTWIPGRCDPRPSR